MLTVLAAVGAWEQDLVQWVHVNSIDSSGCMGTGFTAVSAWEQDLKQWVHGNRILCSGCMLTVLTAVGACMEIVFSAVGAREQFRIPAGTAVIF